MYSKKRTIICITGADGSGKSTLIDSLKKELAEAYEVTVWDMLGNPDAHIFSSKKDVDDYLCLLRPNARLLFLAHALEAAMDKALQSESELILVNAYYYKYFASELTMGADKELENYLASRLPVPDKTIFLSLSPNLSAARKKRFSKYECGCREATPENFIEFQNRSAIEIEKYITPDWHILDATLEPEMLYAMTLKHITE